MQRYAILAMIALFAFMLATSRKPDTLPPDAKPIATHNEWHAYRSERQVDGTLELRDRAGGTVGRWYLDGQRLFSSDGDNPRQYSATLYRDRYFIDPGFDLGTWAGYRASGEGTYSRFQPGVRVSPVRLGFDLFAVDAVFSREVFGAGVSLYPPDNFGRFWRHWGIGSWYVAPFNGDEPGLCFGLTFSTRD